VANSDFSFLLTVLIGTNFGAMHVAAWYFSFPTAAELLIRRICSLLVTLVPVTAIFITIFISTYRWKWSHAVFDEGVVRLENTTS
jgi:hypothetical protein